MKKTYPTTGKARSWWKHLRWFGKRLANRSTRRLHKSGIKDDKEY